MTVFFTSDTHFGDTRVLRIDRRPFANPAAMDEALIANWNAVVGPDDVVWHLGDFAIRQSGARVAALFAALNGRKHLIIGNNDPASTISQPGWESAGHYAEIDVDGVRLVMAHYAFRTWNGMGRGAIDLHGHSHGRLKPMTRQIDVGVDAWDYRPVTLAQMLQARRLRQPPVRPSAEASREIDTDHNRRA